MAYDGEIRFNTKIDNSEVEKDLKRIENQIRRSQESVQKNENARLPYVKQAEALNAKLIEAKRNLASIKADLSAAQNAMGPGASVEDYTRAATDLPGLEKAAAAQAREVASLQKQWDAAKSKVDVYDLKIQQANADIARNSAKAGELGAKLNASGTKMAAAFDRAHVAANRFGRRILAIGKSVLIFNLLYSGLRAVVKYMGKALKTNEQYSAQLAQLKGALLTAFQPIYEFVLPGLLAVLNILTAIVRVVANVLSMLTGKTSSQSAKNAKVLYEEAEAIGAVGGAAKNAQKSLASFDEINTLGTPETGGGGGTSTGITPEFGAFDTAEYKAEIDELTIYMGGALLALGAILAFSGANIPLGIGLMAAGAVGLATTAKANWNSMNKPIKSALTKVLSLLGGASLVIGAILALSGVKLPLGIALMAIGAASMAGAAALNWNSISEALQGPVGTIVALVSGGLLALGAILAFSGASIPLGVALLVAGAVGLAATAAVNWNSLESALKGPIGKVVALISGALLVLGAVLAFSGANIPLGISLLAAGAAGLVTTASVNWSNLESTLKGPVGKVTALASGALLALGLILAFSGVNLPLGIALIGAGAVGLVSVAALNWNSIQEKLKEAWEGIKRWYNTSVAPKLTLEYWKGKFSNIGEALKQKLKDGVNAGIALFNRFISWINKKMMFNWGGFTLFGQEIIPAGSFQLLNIPHIPYLAQGAVLPANKPFLAMVGDQKNGTNVEAPLETIKQALTEVMAMQRAGDISIYFTGDLAQLGRVLKPVIEQEGRRTGASLAKEAFA